MEPDPTKAAGNLDHNVIKIQEDITLNDTAPTASSHDAAPSQNDPFDPKRLRLLQDFVASVGVRRALLTIPVKKPVKEWFVRTHPGEEYRLQTAVLELKEDREIFLVDPVLWQELSTESTFSPRMFVTAMNKQEVLFLWPIRLPGELGEIPPPSG